MLHNNLAMTSPYWCPPSRLCLSYWNTSTVTPACLWLQGGAYNIQKYPKRPGVTGWHTLELPNYSGPCWVISCGLCLHGVGGPSMLSLTGEPHVMGGNSGSEQQKWRASSLNSFNYIQLSIYIIIIITTGIFLRMANELYLFVPYENPSILSIADNSCCPHITGG